ncbi:MAG: ABC transporter ATP-binding protein [Alphaproteobacteria bacterium]|nr:ABC transporter ATP-binding protein [Alphaproteobacteria bacterium]
MDRPSAKRHETSEGQDGALIRFANVSKRFSLEGGEMTAVSDVSLDVRGGEIITLVGPSGCGKSTLLNMTAGLFQPSEGTVFYEGKILSGLNHQVGYMTQSDHLLPWRTVFGNIVAPLEIRRMGKAAARERVESLLETVGLQGFGGSYPNQISGGMRKRTALARLLAYDPQTLLMDEPFGALDALLRLRLQVELRVLARRLQKTVLFVTHDLEEAVALGDRCAVFSARPGRIISIVTIPLPEDRDLMQLRYNSDFTRTCADLWSLLSSELARSGT